MTPSNVGSFLLELRKRQRRSLQHVARKMGKKRISKQALSLIERGRMKVPKARLEIIRRAYRMSVAEEKELERLYAFEAMIENTGEDRDFAEAVLSVVDSTTSNSVYVLGGRKLALTSPILQEKAAAFLQGNGNSISFFYPKIDVRCRPGQCLWHHNTERERFELREAIRAMAPSSGWHKIRFIEIDASVAHGEPIALQLLSMCGPFTTTTIASSASSGHAAGYIYIEGPRDRWILLRSEQAKRSASVMEIALSIANAERGPIREFVDR
jgi:transcriptional regulator with XRE-family HTH domain